jgi:predicted ATP-grasp superfamily ATP-dependent carboligase
MKIFLYEHLTGGGLLADTRLTNERESLAVEGRAMCSALAADFAAIDAVQITCLRDSGMVEWKPECHCLIDVRSAQERDAAFDCKAAEADWTLVIAPEIDGVLAERCRRVLGAGGRLLGGSLACIDLASDKQATAEHLARTGVPVPRGMPFTLGQPWPEEFNYPAIWKPLDGAGSQGLRVIEHSHAPLPAAKSQSGRLEELYLPTYRSARRVPSRWLNAGRHAEGDAALPASVAFLCGPAGCVALPPCRQHLSNDFHYLGGSLPLPPRLAERATQLAARAVSSLPGPLGYFGVDLVLGIAADGRDDMVIEINPRLTTSFIGLRSACRQNLAAAMVAIAHGRASRLSFSDEPVEFRSDGSLVLCQG